MLVKEWAKFFGIFQNVYSSFKIGPCENCRNLHQYNSDILFVRKSFWDGRSMRGIHSRFGLDCWLRSSPTSPCTSRDKTLNIIYGINAFTKKSLWRSFLALMIWIFPIWYLARKKCFKVRLRRRFCLWLEWEVFDKWSLDFPICLTWVSLFIQTFHRDPFAPTDPSICYWHGGGRRKTLGHSHAGS